jgi:3'(2'), 5'-bisphosphate nucleotidase
VNFTQELNVALSAVAEAAKLCRLVQSSLVVESAQKEDRSPVTVADYASQAIVCRRLHEAFPTDPVIGEEDSSDLREGKHQGLGDAVLNQVRSAIPQASLSEVFGWIDQGRTADFSSRFWTLDPIDGTKGFLRKDQYAVSLALIVDGVITVSALACPNLVVSDESEQDRGVVFTAIRGQGARAHVLDRLHAPPQPVRVSRTATSADARFCESFESGHSAHDTSAQIAQRLGMTAPPVRLDSQAKYGVVARGGADIYLRMPTRADYQEKIWDHAGGVLVVEEAGGRVSDINGAPLDFTLGRTLAKNKGVVVTNGLLHDSVIEAIAAVS